MNPRPDPTRRTWGQRLVLALNVVLIVISMSLAGMLGYANDRASAINRVELDRSLTALSNPESGSRTINILLVGSDSSAELDADDPIQIGRQGEHSGDVIIVAHIDERSGNVALLSLPRDLWVPIAGTQREDRINRAFLVGGPATLIDTIEEAFDIPIHHYVNVDFAGFQGLVEAVESVDVFFEAPARDWNVNAQPEPRSQTGFLLTTGGCHALGPEQALAYVRSRYYQTQDDDGHWVTDPTSDLGRIKRQQDFLQRLMQKAIDLGARNPLVLRDLIDVGVQSVAIDQELTPALLVDLSSTYRSFDPGDLQTYTYPVSDGTVGVNRVLIPHHDLAAPVVALFNGEPFDSPESVGVQLTYDEALAGGQVGPTRLPAPVMEVADRLLEADFEIASTTTETGLIDGISIRHGPGGAHAAELAATELVGGLVDGATEIVLVESSALSGRNIEVVVGPPAELMPDTQIQAEPPGFVVAPWDQPDDSGSPIDDLAAPSAGQSEVERPTPEAATNPATTLKIAEQLGDRPQEVPPVADCG